MDILIDWKAKPDLRASTSGSEETTGYCDLLQGPSGIVSAH